RWRCKTEAAARHRARQTVVTTRVHEGRMQTKRRTAHAGSRLKSSTIWEGTAWKAWPYGMIGRIEETSASSKPDPRLDPTRLRTRLMLYRVPEIVTRGRFPDGGESDSTWRTQEARHVGSDNIAPGF